MDDLDTEGDFFGDLVIVNTNWEQRLPIIQYGQCLDNKSNPRPGMHSKFLKALAGVSLPGYENLKAQLLNMEIGHLENRIAVRVYLAYRAASIKEAM